MEQRLTTDPKLLSVLEELKKREPIFHHPEYGTTREAFERMIDSCFWEVGASGSIYSKEFVLDTLEKRYKGTYVDEWETKDFHCLKIAKDNCLLTYTLFQGERVTRRATIWRRDESEWKIVYHQGTIVNE